MTWRPYRSHPHPLASLDRALAIPSSAECISCCGKYMLFQKLGKQPGIIENCINQPWKCFSTQRVKAILTPVIDQKGGRGFQWNGVFSNTGDPIWPESVLALTIQRENPASVVHSLYFLFYHRFSTWRRKMADLPRAWWQEDTHPLLRSSTTSPILANSYLCGNRGRFCGTVAPSYHDLSRQRVLSDERSPLRIVPIWDYNYLQQQRRPFGSPN